MTFAKLVEGTAPPVRASFAVGFAKSMVLNAIFEMEHGRTAHALSALQTTLAMLDSALAPELRTARTLMQFERIGEQS